MYIYIVSTVAVVGLERTFYQVSENVGVVEVCAIVYSPEGDCPIEFLFDVNLIITNGRAGKERVKNYTYRYCCKKLTSLFLVSLMDYQNVSSILAFDTCGTQQCTEIPIEDDMIVELTETLFVTLERTPGLHSRITLNPVDAEIEITDNDGLWDLYNIPFIYIGTEKVHTCSVIIMSASDRKAE